MRPFVRRLATLVLLAALILLPVSAAATEADPASGSTLAARGWIWPLRSFRIVVQYAKPANDYAPGHRGIDLEPDGGDVVRAPDGGVVAFSGMVAGRGILTIDHGDGLVTTLEPIASELHPGDAVGKDEQVGRLSVGGHAAPGTLHFGVRLDGSYISPMLLLGGVRRAVLLPCCD